MGLMPDVIGVFSARVLVAGTDATDFSVPHAHLRLRKRERGWRVMTRQ